MKTGINVCDVMNNNPVIVGPDENAETCAKKMRKNDVGSLIVKKGDKLLGIITEQGLVHKILAKGIDKKISVKDIMIKSVEIIEPYKDIHDALLVMKNEDIRQLPVVDNGKLVGLITLRDILRLEPDLFDLVVDKLKLREGKMKIALQRDIVSGQCEICNNYKKLREVNGQLLCKVCAGGIK